jgi:Subtilisin inhibitor-like
MTMTPQLRPTRPRHRTVLACGLLSACGVLVAACGSTAAPGSAAPAGGATPGTHSASTQPASTTASAKIALTIVSTAPPVSRHWTLRCDPPGGTKPDPAAACRQLIAEPSIFQVGKPKLLMCPMILADASSYVISGTWFGRSVHETVVDGGCDTSRWSELHQIFN